MLILLQGPVPFHDYLLIRSTMIKGLWCYILLADDLDGTENEDKTAVDPEQKETEGGSKYKTKTPCDDLDIHSTCGTRSDLSTGEDLRRRVFYSVLDRMLKELQNRFSGAGGKHRCTGMSTYFRTFLAEHYSIQMKPEEILVAKNFLDRKKKDLVLPTFSFWTRIVFPSLRASFKLPWQSQSPAAVVKEPPTGLRNTTSHERLSNLAIISLEREILANVIFRAAEES